MHETVPPCGTYPKLLCQLFINIMSLTHKVNVIKTIQTNKFQFKLRFIRYKSYFKKYIFRKF